MTTIPLSPAEAGAAPRRQYLAYLPVSLFGSVMGLTGLSVAWHLAASRYGASPWIGDAIGWLAVVAFVALALAYGVKAATAPEAVLAEFRHPIASSLFGTAIISLLLLPIVLVRYSAPLADGLWIAGTVLMVLFAWHIVSRWMSSRQQAAHATPAWIVPVVGLLDVPLAVPSLHLPMTQEISLFAFSVGLFFAVPLFTLIFSRLLFEEPMPAALRPTLMILIAPFSVGFTSYVATTGRIDTFAEALFLLSLFFLAVLLRQLRDLPFACPFRLSWWAVSFPLAATAGAAIRYADHAGHAVFDVVALAILALATLVIAGLAIRTLIGVARGELKALS
ncbi:SLAC1 anion channel family protein [Methylobacterium brachythecii]|uniref:Dicarboxylate transporter/tellurite-resistance protein TehA n=1 Tax=Methylobacterium brachythecii TaxID=1176177 RepID=A0A7W6ARZ0_9HYPH|nr:SLAC1 anion channel family protein [Methylobacterium brachythecii]MBB3904862.1 tellurite resistance protein [Methylobacterium brachythecii]GLS46661.1 dicarboxylate transporter/tellurite-resistance protein TehA [Methylobacterium brachythecii]